MVRGYLHRTRVAEVPDYLLKIKKNLKQGELAPFFKMLRKVKVLVYYFCPYENQYVTREFYIPKPKIRQKRLPKNNNTNNIIYDSFDVVLKGYGDI